MPEWLISLISVIVGAAIGIGGAELIKWFKRPILEIDFEEREGHKPYIPDYNDELEQSQGDSQATYKLKSLRLNVHNTGKKPAMDCEAKVELSSKQREQSTYRTTLHWARRDPALYMKILDNGSNQFEIDRIYAPINLNIDDREAIDVFCLPYWYYHVSDKDRSPHYNPYIGTVSLRQLVLHPNTTYQIKTTVYASNVKPKSFSFQANWDGSLEGFNKAFTKDKGVNI